jgi:hypothetical protein
MCFITFFTATQVIFNNGIYAVGFSMIDVSWIEIDKQDVILFTFHPSWIWRNFHQAQNKVSKMLASSTRNFPIFFDFRNASNLPPGMIKEMRNIIEAWHPNGTPLVVIGGNQIIHNAFMVAGRMLNASALLEDIIFVGSFAAAEACLRREDSERAN